MKLQGIIRVTLLSAFALTTPFLTFAGSQYDRSQTQNSVQTQNPQSETRVLQTRKNTGDLRPVAVVRTDIEIETPQAPVCVVYGNHTCPNWNDGPAFHK